MANLLASVILALGGCSSSGERVVLDVQGTARNYYLHVPEGLEGPAPLVLTFHGGGPSGGSKGRGMDRATGLNTKADAEGFVVAYPSSYAGNWADGRETPYAPPPEVDDLAFIDALLADVADRAPVDPTRVYATGMSNGGFFTQRLACERTAVFAAVAPVIASMAVDLPCAPGTPLPVLMINGHDDPLVLWEGGAVAGQDRGEGQPVEQVVDFWVTTDACPNPPALSDDPDVDPEDGTRIHRRQWTGCAGGSEVLLLDIEGGGHGWPGGAQYLPERTIGRVSQDVRATDEVWAFFQRHAR